MDTSNFAMDTSNVINMGTQAYSWKEQVEQLIPDTVRHLVVNISPQKQPSHEKNQCFHEYTATWTNILDLIINQHNASCKKDHQSFKDVNVTVTVTLPDSEPVSVPISVPVNIQNDDKSSRMAEHIDIPFNNTAENMPISEDEDSDSADQDSDESDKDWEKSQVDDEEEEEEDNHSDQGEEEESDSGSDHKSKNIQGASGPVLRTHNTRQRKPTRRVYCESQHTGGKSRTNVNKEDSDDEPNRKGYKHKCPECNRSFKLKQTLKRHMIHIHDPTFTGRKQCDVCETWFDSQEKLASHLEAPGENHGKHPCTSCDVTCKTEYRLRLHMKSNHKLPKPSVQCDICQKIFSRRASLKKHKRLHIRPDEYPCSQCDKVFKAEQHLKRHAVIHSEIMSHKCDICGEGFRQAFKLKTHKSKAHDVHEKHPCTQCNAVFKQKSTLQDHMMTHTGQQAFLCDLCGQSFSRPAIYRLHTLRHKEKANPKAFPCPQCDRAYPNQGRVNKHIREMHLKEKNYKCKFCPKTFFHSSGVIKHEKTHTGEYDYKCTYCDLKFIARTQQIIHERVHTGEKPYFCEICNKTFSRKDKLNEHKKKTHPPEGSKPDETSFQCTICGAVFKNHAGCIAHEKRHAAIKSNICDICGAAFVSNSDLIRHIKIHTDGKPHFCKQCGLSFTKKSELNQHVVVHVMNN